jgi:hypothetical protein
MSISKLWDAMSVMTGIAMFAMLCDTFFGLTPRSVDFDQMVYPHNLAFFASLAFGIAGCAYLFAIPLMLDMLPSMRTPKTELTLEGVAFTAGVALGWLVTTTKLYFYVPVVFWVMLPLYLTFTLRAMSLSLECYRFQKKVGDRHLYVQI